MTEHNKPTNQTNEPNQKLELRPTAVLLWQNKYGRWAMEGTDQVFGTNEMSAIQRASDWFAHRFGSKGLYFSCKTESGDIILHEYEE
jgi:hypothetical protein